MPGGMDRAGLGHAKAVGDLGDRRRCTGLETRSARLVVATEQVKGWRGMPTQQFSRTRISTRRKLPALGGTEWSIMRVVDADHGGGARAGLCQVEAAGLAVEVVAQVDQDPRLPRRRSSRSPWSGCRPARPGTGHGPSRRWPGRWAGGGSQRPSAARNSRTSLRHSARAYPSRPRDPAASSSRSPMRTAPSAAR